MKHPNKKFLDDFLNPVKKDRTSLVYRASHECEIETKKEKFKIFLEEIDKPKNNFISNEILKFLNYNTFSNSQYNEKIILESKKELGSLPKQFFYNSLLYQFHQEMGVFINQYGHTVSIDQASAFMDMIDLDPTDVGASESDTDGGGFTPLPSVIAYPEAPSGLTAQLPTSTGTTLTWNDNSDMEEGFKVFYYNQT